MPTLTNESTRGLGLPGWRDRGAMILQPGSSVEVSIEYFAHLKAEVPGVSAFFALRRSGIRVTERTCTGAELLPPALVKRMRASAEFEDTLSALIPESEWPSEEQVAKAVTAIAEHLDDRDARLEAGGAEAATDDDADDDEASEADEEGTTVDADGTDASSGTADAADATADASDDADDDAGDVASVTDDKPTHAASKKKKRTR